MITEPKLDNRDEQPYVGIRVWATMPEFSTVIPQTHDELFAWMREHDVQPAGAPFVRYHVINMPGMMEIEMGVPVETPAVAGDDRVKLERLPAGRYASVLYTGDYSGLMEANRVLIDWAKDNGIKWDNWQTEQGDVFACRLENYFTDPGEEPDSSKWETEVAIKLAPEA